MYEEETVGSPVQLRQLQEELQEETKSRVRQEELNSRLQDEYDILLKKLAQAELHIDQLRLRANVNINKRFILSHHSNQASTLQQDLLGSRAGAGSSNAVAKTRASITGLRHGKDIDDHSREAVHVSQSYSHPRKPSTHDTTLLLHSSLQQLTSQGHPIQRQGLGDHFHSTHGGGQPNYDSPDTSATLERQLSQVLSDTASDTPSQLSEGYITSHASAESRHLSQIFRIRSLQEQIATLKGKLSSDRSSFEELSGDLGNILDSHGKLASEFAESKEQLSDLKEKYKDKAALEIARRKEVLENELMALAEQLKDLDSTLRSKAQLGSSIRKSQGQPLSLPTLPTSPHLLPEDQTSFWASQQHHREEDITPDNSPSLPAKYYDNTAHLNSTNSSTEPGLDGSHSPATISLEGPLLDTSSCISNMAELHHVPDLPEDSVGTSRGDIRGDNASRGDNEVRVRSSNFGESEGGTRDPVGRDKKLPELESGVESSSSSNRRRDSFKSRIPRRVQGSLASPPKLVALRRRSIQPVAGLRNGKISEDKRRKMSSPAVMEAQSLAVLKSRRANSRVSSGRRESKDSSISPQHSGASNRSMRNASTPKVHLNTGDNRLSGSSPSNIPRKGILKKSSPEPQASGEASPLTERRASYIIEAPSGGDQVFKRCGSTSPQSGERRASYIEVSPLTEQVLKKVRRASNSSDHRRICSRDASPLSDQRRVSGSDREVATSSGLRRASSIRRDSSPLNDERRTSVANKEVSPLTEQVSKRRDSNREISDQVSHRRTSERDVSPISDQRHGLSGEASSLPDQPPRRSGSYIIESSPLTVPVPQISVSDEETSPRVSTSIPKSPSPVLATNAPVTAPQTETETSPLVSQTSDVANEIPSVSEGNLSDKGLVTHTASVEKTSQPLVPPTSAHQLPSTSSHQASPTYPHLPSTSSHQLPSTSAHQLPSTSAHQLPSTSAHQLPSTSAHQLPSTSPHQLPSTSPHQLPSTSAHQASPTYPHLPSTSSHQLPSTSPHQLPSTSAHQLPSTSAHQLPSTSPHQASPTLSNQQLPTSSQQLQLTPTSPHKQEQERETSEHGMKSPVREEERIGEKEGGNKEVAEGGGVKNKNVMKYLVREEGSEEGVGEKGAEKEEDEEVEGDEAKKKNPKLTLATMDALRKELLQLREQLLSSVPPSPVHSASAPDTSPPRPRPPGHSVSAPDTSPPRPRPPGHSVSAPDTSPPAPRPHPGHSVSAPSGLLSEKQAALSRDHSPLHTPASLSPIMTPVLDSAGLQALLNSLAPPPPSPDRELPAPPTSAGGSVIDMDTAPQLTTDSEQMTTPHATPTHSHGKGKPRAYVSTPQQTPQHRGEELAPISTPEHVRGAEVVPVFTPEHGRGMEYEPLLSTPDHKQGMEYRPPLPTPDHVPGMECGPPLPTPVHTHAMEVTPRSTPDHRMTKNNGGMESEFNSGMKLGHKISHRHNKMEPSHGIHVSRPAHRNENLTAHIPAAHLGGMESVLHTHHSSGMESLKPDTGGMKSHATPTHSPPGTPPPEMSDMKWAYSLTDPSLQPANVRGNTSLPGPGQRRDAVRGNTSLPGPGQRRDAVRGNTSLPGPGQRRDAVRRASISSAQQEEASRRNLENVTYHSTDHGPLEARHVRTRSVSLSPSGRENVSIKGRGHHALSRPPDLSLYTKQMHDPSFRQGPVSPHTPASSPDSPALSPPYYTPDASPTCFTVPSPGLDPSDQGFSDSDSSLSEFRPLSQDNIRLSTPDTPISDTTLLAPVKSDLEHVDSPPSYSLTDSPLGSYVADSVQDTSLSSFGHHSGADSLSRHSRSPDKGHGRTTSGRSDRQKEAWSPRNHPDSAFSAVKRQTRSRRGATSSITDMEMGVASPVTSTQRSNLYSVNSSHHHKRRGVDHTPYLRGEMEAHSNQGGRPHSAAQYPDVSASSPQPKSRPRDTVSWVMSDESRAKEGAITGANSQAKHDRATSPLHMDDRISPSEEHRQNFIEEEPLPRHGYTTSPLHGSRFRFCHPVVPLRRHTSPSRHTPFCHLRSPRSPDKGFPTPPTRNPLLPHPSLPYGQHRTTPTGYMDETGYYSSTPLQAHPRYTSPHRMASPRSFSSTTPPISPIHTHLVSAPPPDSPDITNPRQKVYLYKYAKSATHDRSRPNLKHMPGKDIHTRYHLQEPSSPERADHRRRRRLSSSGQSRHRRHHRHHEDPGHYHINTCSPSYRNFEKGLLCKSASSSSVGGEEEVRRSCDHRECRGMCSYARDPLLVVNIHKKPRGHNDRRRGGDATSGGVGYSWQRQGVKEDEKGRQVYDVDVSSSDSEDEGTIDNVQHVGRAGIDLKGAVKLARQLRKRSEKMRGTLQMELTRQGLL